MKTTSLLVLTLLCAVGQAPRHEVISGLLRSSIDLKTPFNPLSPEVVWKHKTLETIRRIAKIQNGVMTEGNTSKYNLSLNGTVLSIGDLSESDNGVYIAEASWPDGRLEEKLFDVKVYEPVPPAKIIPKVKRIGDQFNVTLHCSVQSKTSELSYTWKYRHRDSEYQSMNDTGNMIQMMLPLDHQDMDFICTVQNPVDQKNASYHIDHCSGQAPRHEVISGLLRSSIDLKTPFNPLSPEVVWKHKTLETIRRIAKIQNGVMTEGNSSKYNPGLNGTVLSIGDLSESDNGVYIAEVSWPDGRLVEKFFNVTVYEKMKERHHYPLIFSVMSVLLVCGIIRWICWKTPARGDQNENLPPPVQDTESQESPFNEIPSGKMGMKKTEEEDEEDSKLIDKPPNCDHSVVEVEPSL